jgi:hypothetical protein
VIHRRRPFAPGRRARLLTAASATEPPIGRPCEPVNTVRVTNPLPTGRPISVDRSEPVFLNCPRCGLSIRVRATWLAPEHCPRCLARARIAVRLFFSPLSPEELYAKGSAPGPDRTADDVSSLRAERTRAHAHRRRRPCARLLGSRREAAAGVVAARRRECTKRALALSEIIEVSGLARGRFHLAARESSCRRKRRDGGARRKCSRRLRFGVEIASVSAVQAPRNAVQEER